MQLLITDTTVIVGSANLNMRSLAGDRDSEIAAVITSREMASDMRKELWKEHLGESVKLTDNIEEDVEQWEAIARSNTKVYRKTFEHSNPICGPSNKDKFLESEKTFRYGIWENIDAKRSYELLANRIRGHLIKFPKSFLEEDVKNTEKVKNNPLSMLSPSMFSQLKEAAVVNFKEDLVQ